MCCICTWYNQVHAIENKFRFLIGMTHLYACRVVFCQGDVYVTMCSISGKLPEGTKAPTGKKARNFDVTCIAEEPEYSAREFVHGRLTHLARLKMADMLC